MAEERRSAPRARISGVRVTYESATGDHVETDALNLGRGGLFVRAANPLAVGKRLTLDIQVAGELVPWSALGRVVWTRQQDEGERSPPGMGVKLIDIEDVVVAAIDQLVAGREHGVAVEQVATTDPTPVVSVAPSRERTILGIGSLAPEEPGAPPERSFPRAPSIPIDLVALDGTPGALPRGARSPGRAAEASMPRDQAWNENAAPDSSHAAPTSERRSDVQRRGGTRWIVVFLMLIAAAGAAYAVLDGDLDRVLRPSEPVTSPQTAPVAPIPVQALTTVTAAPPSPPIIATTANPTSAAPTTSSAPAPSFGVTAPGVTAPRKTPSASPVPSPAHPPAVKRPPTEENNPY